MLYLLNSNLIGEIFPWPVKFFFGGIPQGLILGPLLFLFFLREWSLLHFLPSIIIVLPNDSLSVYNIFYDISSHLSVKHRSQALTTQTVCEAFLFYCVKKKSPIKQQLSPCCWKPSGLKTHTCFKYVCTSGWVISDLCEGEVCPEKLVTVKQRVLYLATCEFSRNADDRAYCCFPAI